MRAALKTSWRPESVNICTNRAASTSLITICTFNETVMKPSCIKPKRMSNNIHLNHKPKEPETQSVSMRAGRSALLPAFVLCDPRLHQLFQKGRGQRLVHRETDGAFGSPVVLELVLERNNHWRTHGKQTAMV